MRINFAIRKIMREKNVSLSAMAALLGKSRGNDISARLVNKNQSCDKIVEMLDALDYKLVAMPKDMELPSKEGSGGVYVIDQKDSKISLV